jgi:hypothetical protein
MIYGGQVANASARHRKQERREVCSVKVVAPAYLDWSDKPITFDRDDHPDFVPSPGRYPLVVDPIIGNARLSKVLMNGGSSFNIIYAETLELLGVDRSEVRAGAAPFHGIAPGKRILPSGGLTCPSASELPPTSERKPSPSRWLGSEGPTTRCWEGRATPSSWPSPTTPTSSSRCQASLLHQRSAIRDQNSLPADPKAALHSDSDTAEAATLLRVSPGDCGVILSSGRDHLVPRGLG